jgi:hypothetical protein
MNFHRLFCSRLIGFFSFKLKPIIHAIVVLVLLIINYVIMAKYSEKAGEKIEKTMHEMKEGKLKSGNSDKKVTSRKQAIAIGLSEARKEGARVPKKKS